MQRIGIRELKEHASEVMRRVREERDSYVVTFHGRAIARIVPTQEAADAVTPREWLGRWDELGKEISAGWPADVSAVDAVRDQRRELE
jgi:prevent-host-death family protein